MELGSYGLSSDPLILLFPELEAAEDMGASGDDRDGQVQNDQKGKKWLTVRGGPTLWGGNSRRPWIPMASPSPGKGRKGWLFRFFWEFSYCKQYPAQADSLYFPGRKLIS